MKARKKENLLKVSEIAELLGVSDRTVRYWITDGILPAQQAREKGMYFILKKDLDNALKYKSGTKSADEQSSQLEK